MKTCNIVHKVMSHKFEGNMLQKSASALAQMMYVIDRGFLELSAIAEDNPKVLKWIEETKLRCDQIAEKEI